MLVSSKFFVLDLFLRKLEKSRSFNVGLERLIWHNFESLKLFPLSDLFELVVPKVRFSNRFSKFSSQLFNRINLVNGGHYCIVDFFYQRIIIYVGLWKPIFPISLVLFFSRETLITNLGIIVFWTYLWIKIFICFPDYLLLVH